MDFTFFATFYKHFNAHSTNVTFSIASDEHKHSTCTNLSATADNIYIFVRISLRNCVSIMTFNALHVRCMYIHALKNTDMIIYAFSRRYDTRSKKIQSVPGPLCPGVYNSYFRTVILNLFEVREHF